MKLQDLLADLPYLVETRGDMDIQIDAITVKSKEPVTNGLFFCIPGARFDAHDFAPEASVSGV